jgi:hypothetical protein
MFETNVLFGAPEWALVRKKQEYVSTFMFLKIIVQCRRVVGGRGRSINTLSVCTSDDFQLKRGWFPLMEEKPVPGFRRFLFESGLAKNVVDIVI